VLEDGIGTPDEAALWSAARSMTHRGPDGAEVWSEPGAGLAHTRLAIIDRAHGVQPMFTADGRYGVVFNGEIYNHHQLRRELEAAGCPLRTRCDTEILPYLYERHGKDMVHRLRGMFAFAVYDRRERSLFLARDRFGKKPLALAQRDGALFFASTLDALVEVAGVEPQVDPQSLLEYLVMQYVPSPRSPYAGTRKMGPGQCAEWKDGQLHVTTYWEPPARGGERRGEPTPADLLDLRHRVADSVGARLESEVPMGIFLSGGIDSSVVVAEARGAGIRPVTFSVGFRSAGYDESSHARVVADRFDTDHTELSADDDPGGLFDAFVAAYDEPLADASALATLAVAKAAHGQVTVVLTGDGGDETFGGYARYHLYRRARAWRSRFGPLAPLMGPAASVAGRLAGRSRLSTGGRFLEDPWRAYRSNLFHFDPLEAASLFRTEVASGLDVMAPVRRLDGLWDEGSSAASGLLRVDQRTYLPDDLLLKMDRATMAFSLEARSPLLDHELASHVATFPDRWLFEGGRGKRILREAYRDVLPAQILDRPKHAFSVPIHLWMRGELRSRLDALVTAEDSVLFEWFDPLAVRRLVTAFLAGDDGRKARVWNLLALAGWAAHRLRAPRPNHDPTSLQRSSRR